MLDKSYYDGKENPLGGRFTCYALNRNGTDYDVDKQIRTVELVPEGDGYDLVVTDQMTSLAGKTPDVRWSMTTPAHAELISDTCISLSQNGVTMYLTATEESGAALKFFVRDANTEQTWDEYNEGATLVGFEGTMEAETTWKLTTRLSIIKP